MFNPVLLNGVLGYGPDRSEDVGRALTSIAFVLRQGGLVVIGWDDNMAADLLGAAMRTACFNVDAELLGAGRGPI